MKDQWLSDIIGANAYTVSPTESALYTCIFPGFYTVKIPTSDVRLAQKFERWGFYIVDTAITMIRPASRVEFIPFKTGIVRPEDFSALVDIAESSFCSRFHLDPKIDPELANTIKRVWLGNYLSRTRGDQLFVRREEGKPVGFLAAIIGQWDRQAAWVIDLIAVAAEARGNGIGVNLIAAYLAYFPALPAIVGTQARNIASMALYNKMGFRIAKTEFVLHAHLS